MASRFIWVLLTLALCHPGLAQSRKQVFLIGDSISIYYTPYLQSDLADVVLFSRKGRSQIESVDEEVEDPQANGGDSRAVLNYLRMRFNDDRFHPDIVLVNCGLHDIKRNPKTNVIQIDSSEYRKNLIAIFALLHLHKARVIWISSTPVDDARHNLLSKQFYRYNADVERYNRIAREICATRHIPIIDLYEFTAHLGKDHYIDHVHFDTSTRELQAAFIAGAVTMLLNNSY
jgi:lysophospholipase L1-like esterase